MMTLDYGLGRCKIFKMEPKTNENFLSKKRFSKMIEQTVIDKQLSYMDAIVYLCEENAIEIEDVKKYISPVIQNKLLVEAQRLNFIAGETYNTFS